MRIVPNKKLKAEHNIPHVMVKMGDDNKYKPGYIVTCSSCGTHAQKIYTGGVVPETVVRKAFMNQGWFIGKHDYRDQDKCPACIAKKKAVPKPVSPPPARETLTLFPKPAVMETPMPVTIVKPAPQPLPVLDRATKRKLLDVIDDVYGETCYHPGWTDQRIADEHRVDVAIVAALRDEFYGPAVPEKTRESLAKDLAELQRTGSKLMDEQAALLQQMDHVQNTFEAGMKALRNRLDATNERLEDLKQDYEKLHAEAMAALGIKAA